MKKLYLTGFLFFLSLHTWAQSNSLKQSNFFDRYLKDRLLIYAGSNIGLFNPAPFYNQNTGKRFGWEMGAAYQLFHDDGFDFVVGLSRSYYSFQGERRHNDILHVVHFMAYQNSTPVYMRTRLGKQSPLYLRVGVRMAFWSDSFYVYDIYKNGRLVYHGRSRTGLKGRQSPGFVSIIYGHAALECRCYRKWGLYAGADIVPKYSRIHFGLLYSL